MRAGLLIVLVTISVSAQSEWQMDETTGHWWATETLVKSVSVRDPGHPHGNDRSPYYAITFVAVPPDTCPDSLMPIGDYRYRLGTNARLMFDLGVEAISHGLRVNVLVSDQQVDQYRKACFVKDMTLLAKDPVPTWPIPHSKSETGIPNQLGDDAPSLLAE